MWGHQSLSHNTATVLYLYADPAVPQQSNRHSCDLTFVLYCLDLCHVKPRVRSGQLELFSGSRTPQALPELNFIVLPAFQVAGWLLPSKPIIADVLLRYLSLILLLGISPSSQDLGRFEPLARCADCVPANPIRMPGIGFDLTPSYGYASFLSICLDVEGLIIFS